MMRMSTVTRTTIRMVSPFLVAYGAYLIVYGHLSPGGGFQGGVILALSVILMMIAQGYQDLKTTFRDKLVKGIESGAALGILLLAFSGLLFGTFFFNYLRGGTPGELFSGGIIAPFNVLIGFKIGASFTLVFYILIRRMNLD